MITEYHILEGQNGYGRILFKKTKTWFEGFIRDSKANGFGCYHFASGDFYKGEFKKGKREGLGQMISVESKVSEMAVWKAD